jgi:type I restriction enzyme R subunit
VIIDELHSSQSGELSKELKKSLSKSEEDDDEFDYEEMLRKEIQSRGKQSHISFFGFTGTPKEKTLELTHNIPWGFSTFLQKQNYCHEHLQ